MPTATQSTSEAQINQLNLTMRQQPWYQDWFRQRGLDPNRVRLTESQRADLTRVAAQQGFQLGDRMKFDEAGNINQQGGFAGMPTWAKIAISAAPAAATLGFGAAGIGPAAGMFGGTGGATTAAGTAAGTAGGGATAATTAAGATGAGGFLSSLGNVDRVLDTIGRVGNLAGGGAAQRAEDRGAQAEYDLARQALEQNRISNANTQAMALAQQRLAAENARMRQLQSADMLGSSKPPTDPRAIISSAGYMSPETIEMMRSRAMKALESGSDVPELEKLGPTPTMPQGSGTDRFLNTLSTGGSIAGIMRELGLFGQRSSPSERLGSRERVGSLDDLLTTLPAGQPEPAFDVYQRPAQLADYLPENRFGRVNFGRRGVRF